MTLPYSTAQANPRSLIAAPVIQLTWPGKGMTPTQSAEGSWALCPPESSRSIFGVVGTKSIGNGDISNASFLIAGPRLAALQAISKHIPHGVRFAYADLPRIEGFDEDRAFQAVDTNTYSTWLTVVAEHFRSVLPMLCNGGVLVAHTGDGEEPYVRLLLQELLGPTNYIGSIVWQTHYSPKGGRPTSDISPVHEVLICFTTEKASLRRIALSKAPEKYENRDGDPRGEWNADQKDAGRDTVKLTYNVPPYRWDLISGELPPGVWRVSPMSGVLWAEKLTKAGRFCFSVRVTDEADASSEANVTIEVLPAGEADNALPDDIWWRQSPPVDSDSSPKIVEVLLPVGHVGKSYRAVLKADGGKPYRGMPRPGRGWGFGEKTLILSLLEDRCYFGKKGTAIPQPKSYLKDLADGLKLTNVTSWWPGETVGWTQDATKHLNGLKANGTISEVNPTAKPESLLLRLLDMFTKEDEMVLELFATSANLASAAVKANRRVIGLTGGSVADHRMLDGTSLPRLEAVLNGRDHLPERSGDEDDFDDPGKMERRPKSKSKKAVSPLVHSSPRTSRIDLLQVVGPVAVLLPGEELYRLASTSTLTEAELMRAVLGAEGFISSPDSDSRFGCAVNGSARAAILSPSAFLDRRMADELATANGATSEKLVVYYFRCAEDFAPLGFSSRNVIFKRVPMDLGT